MLFARKLCRSLLQNNSNLTAAVIDALSNLNMADSIAEEVGVNMFASITVMQWLHARVCKVLDVALDRVQSADIADLPTVIKFVVQYISPRNAQEVLLKCDVMGF